MLMLDEREAKRCLRLAQDHLLEMHLALGAHSTALSLVEVITHQYSRVPELNYVVPRRKTAWITASEVAVGLEQLQQLKRVPRLQYVEGVFPASFADHLSSLNLHLDQRTPILVCRRDALPAPILLPDGYTFERLPAHHADALFWWDVWRSPSYAVHTLGTEPLVLGQADAIWTDLVLRHEGKIIGIARLSFHHDSAHLVALALHQQHSQLFAPFATHACLYAFDRPQIGIVFGTAKDGATQFQMQNAGFWPLGVMVCYAASGERGQERIYDTLELAQFVLSLRHL
jgi:hypothetical protein